MSVVSIIAANILCECPLFPDKMSITIIALQFNRSRRFFVYILLINKYAIASLRYEEIPAVER